MCGAPILLYADIGNEINLQAAIRNIDPWLRPFFLQFSAGTLSCRAMTAGMLDAKPSNDWTVQGLAMAD
jgi:hypothetical protein